MATDFFSQGEPFLKVVNLVETKLLFQLILIIVPENDFSGIHGFFKCFKPTENKKGLSWIVFI